MHRLYKKRSLSYLGFNLDPCYNQNRAITNRVIKENKMHWLYKKRSLSRLGSNLDPCYNPNCAITNHVIKRFRCMSFK